MAVSNRILALLAALAVGLAWWDMMTVATSVVQSRRESAAEQAAVQSLRDSVYTLGLGVRTAALRARVDSAMGSYGSGSPPDVVRIGAAAPAAAALAESLFATLPVPPVPASRWVLAVVEVPAMARMPIGTLMSFAILPSATAGDACTTVVLVQPRSGWEQRYWRGNPFDGAAGPCWYLARFGAPGPEVRAWLDARYWDVAGGIPPHDRSLVYAGDDLAGAGILDRVFGNVATQFYQESVTLEGCAGRRPQLCEDAFLRMNYPAGLLPAGIGGNNRFTSYLRFSSEGYTNMGGTLGVPRAATEALLAMMVDDLGPARFAEFWASRASVAEAFEAAAGRPLGEWYRTQLRRQMAVAGIPEPRTAVIWPSVLSILALALGGTLWHAGRRRVR